VHKATQHPEFEWKQCSFGEHLLIDKAKPVALVESEKTSVIASVYLPQFIWVAVGRLTNLNADRCSILKGRTVLLFHDIDGFEKWSSKANELEYITKFTISNLLNSKATETERKQKFDIADYLIKFDLEAFTKPKAEQLTLLPTVQTFVEVGKFEQPTPIEYFSEPEQPKPECWEQDITELENYFASIELPTQPVKLNQCTTITDCSLFIEHHLSTIKANCGNRIFLPYLDRLMLLQKETK
jgi:hypothetical protein